jgi:hypothetical protein
MPMVVLTGEELGKASGEGDGISTKAITYYVHRKNYRYIFGTYYWAVVKIICWQRHKV